MKSFKVVMKERGADGKIRTIEQTAFCENRQQVIEWYGLNEPDIVDYTITEEKDGLV